MNEKESPSCSETKVDGFVQRTVMDFSVHRHPFYLLHLKSMAYGSELRIFSIQCPGPTLTLFRRSWSKDQGPLVLPQMADQGVLVQLQWWHRWHWWHWWHGKKEKEQRMRMNGAWYAKRKV